MVQLNPSQHVLYCCPSKDPTEQNCGKDASFSRCQCWLLLMYSAMHPYPALLLFRLLVSGPAFDFVVSLLLLSGFRVCQLIIPPRPFPLPPCAQLFPSHFRHPLASLGSAGSVLADWGEQLGATCYRRCHRAGDHRSAVFIPFSYALVMMLLILCDSVCRAKICSDVVVVVAVPCFLCTDHYFLAQQVIFLEQKTPCACTAA